MPEAKELLTNDSIKTFGGGTLSTWVVTNVYSNIFPSRPIKEVFIALVFALVWSFAFTPKKDRKGTGLVIAFVNGLLVLSSAIGLNTTNASTGGSTEAATAAPSVKDSTKHSALIPFFDNHLWLPPVALTDSLVKDFKLIDTLTKTVAVERADNFSFQNECDSLYKRIAEANIAPPAGDTVVPTQNVQLALKGIDTSIIKVDQKSMNAMISRAALRQIERRNRYDSLYMQYAKRPTAPTTPTHSGDTAKHDHLTTTPPTNVKNPETVKKFNDAVIKFSEPKPPAEQPKPKTWIDTLAVNRVKRDSLKIQIIKRLPVGQPVSKVIR